LTALFKDSGVKSAYVVKMRNGRSRGYGFVTFNDEAAQQKALNSFNDQEVATDNGPRKLSVKVALDGDPRAQQPASETDAQ
jgi:RNA recognition motif-containing protein